MKNIVFIIFLLVINNAIAQPYIPFPTDSAQWSVRHTINSPFSQSTVQYKMKGDTLLNGIIYHKVYYSLDLAYSSSNQALHCFVREDTTKKVYVKYPFGSSMDTTEFVLYDFNLAIGDTFAIKLFNFTTDSILKFELTSRFSYPTLTDTSEDYQLQALAPSFWPCTVALGLEWISGVGAWLGPFYNEIPQDGCDGGSYEISCFWHRGNYVLGGTFCDYATGINEEANRTNILLYPNPANEEINIVFNDISHATALVEISDIHGKLIERVSLKSGVPYNYNAAALPKSVYMVSLYIDNELVENKKFVLIK
jgi:hypothetical protein